MDEIKNRTPRTGANIMWTAVCRYFLTRHTFPTVRQRLTEPLEERRLLYASPIDDASVAAAIASQSTYEIASGAYFERVERSAASTVSASAAPRSASLTGVANVLSTSIVNPNRSEGLQINFNYGPDLLAHPQAAALKGAFERAAEYWESLLGDPITLAFDADYTPSNFGSPFVAGQATAYFNSFNYSDVRDRLIADASPEESLVNSLPAVGALTFNTFPGVNVTRLAAQPDNPILSLASANAKSLGFTNLFQTTSEFATGPIDASIIFNSTFSVFPYDFDPRDGLLANHIDFEGLVRHEIGHALGFFSAQGNVDSIASTANFVDKFDFGSASSPVEPSYAAVHPSVRYNSTLGYGWSTGVLGSFDNAALGDSITRDGNTLANGGSATFQVNVPNGKYNLEIVGGNLGAATDSAEIRLEGVALSTFPSASAGQLTTRVLNGVQVNDGVLTLTLTDTGGTSDLSSIVSLKIVSASLPQVSPTTLDLFRLAPNQGANFSTAPRILSTGEDAPIQVFHDGRYDVTPFAGVDLNEDGTVNSADAISKGDVPLATGSFLGDGDQSGHWKAEVRLGLGGIEVVTGVSIGIMDPNVVPNEILVASPTDLRALGLIGWDVYNRGAAAPSVSVNPLVTNDNTPTLTGGVSSALSGAVEDPRVFVGIAGQLGNNTVSFTVDGNTEASRGFIVKNDLSSKAKVAGVDVILPGDGSRSGLLFASHFSTGPGGSFSPYRDFDAVPSEAAAVGLTSPQSDAINDQDVRDASKTLNLDFNDFDPGETLHWAIDIDPGAATGDTITNSTIIVYWDNGLATRGTLSRARILRGSLLAPGSDEQGPFATAIDPNGDVQGSYSRLLVRFNEPIQDGTFTLDDIVLFENALGPIAVSAVNKIDSENYEVVFPTQTAVSPYFMQLGPNILDLAGNSMDQDRDGINGEATQDIFGASWNNRTPGADVYTPSVVFAQARGPSAGVVDRFVIVFDEAINPDTLTLDDVLDLYGPSGPVAGKITPTGITKIADNEYQVNFAPQTDLGEYQLVLGNDIRDLAGNKLTVNGSYVRMQQEYAILAVKGPTGAWSLDGSKIPALADGKYDVRATVFDSSNAKSTDFTAGELIIDTVAPTVTISAVNPAVRNTSVDEFAIVFSEPVVGVDLSDLSLKLNGGANLLTGAESLTTSDNITWKLSGVSGITASEGSFKLALESVDSNIRDGAGNALSKGGAVEFLIDLTSPTANVLAISPNPRNTAVNEVEIAFSEAVTGFDIEDLVLTQDGEPVSLAGVTLNSVDGRNFVLNGLSSKTSVAGSYWLTLNAAASGISDLAGNSLLVGDAENWVVDLSPVSGSISPVSPDPRNEPVNTLVIKFSEPVLGFDLNDLALRRNGLPVAFSGAETLTTSDQITWAVNGLSSVTSADGAYQVVLNAAASGVTDLAGNALSEDLTEAWVKDASVLTASIVEVVPDPRNQGVDTLRIVFSTGVSGLDLGDLRLTRGGGSNLLTGTETLKNVDAKTWEVSGLSALTSAAGSYEFRLVAAGSNIQDEATNPLSGDAVEAFVVDLTAPMAMITPVSPDPRVSGVNSIAIEFSEAVVGFDISDLTLLLGGEVLPLSPAATLVTSDNETWQLAGLGSITAADGVYELQLAAAGSGITDTAGNALANDSIETWVVDGSLLSASITPISPDPRNSGVDSIEIVFSESVTGFDISDLSLVRNGLPINLSDGPTLTSADNVTWVLGGLSGLTSAEGSYTLTLNAADSGIVDGTEQSLVEDASQSWSVDTTAPTVDVVDVQPDPRNTSVDRILLVFSEPVTGLKLSDLTLRLGSTAANRLTGLESLTTSDNITWELSGLQTITQDEGKYELQLNAAGSTIDDAAGNMLASDAGDVWTNDQTGPTLTIAPVSPNPRPAALDSVQIVFSEPVEGLQLSDLTLNRNSGVNLLTGAETLTTVDGKTFILSGLSGLTQAEGVYTIALLAKDSGIADLAQNPLVEGDSESWTVDTTAPSTKITPVTPDPRATPVDSVEIVFSEAVAGFDLADLALSRDGAPVALNESVVVSTLDNVTFQVSGLAGLTAAEGKYQLSVGTQWTDVAGNAPTSAAQDVWTVDLTGPSIDFIDVTPSPRNTPVPSITIVFDESVQGFDLTDLELSRDGKLIPLSPNQSLTSEDGITWTLGELSSLTSNAGNYVLSLVSDTGIVDAVGNGPVNVDSTSWQMDVSLPVADIVDVTPDPRTNSVGSVQIVFSEVVTGVDVADFVLTRDGGPNLLNGLATLSSTDNQTFTLQGLSSLTAVSGSYELRLVSAGSGIVDSVGNALSGDALDVWVVDALAPTAQISAVVPNPRNGEVDSLTITFSEPVSGFDLSDLRLSRNRGPNLLQGTETLTSDDNQTWILSGLQGITQEEGTYAITLTAANSNITDALGNALNADARQTWVTDLTSPQVDILAVTPNPTNKAVDSLVIAFTEPVTGFDISDLSLLFGGEEDLLTGTESLTTEDGRVYVLSGLAPSASNDGEYQLRLTARRSDITDLAGNSLVRGASESWVLDTTAPRATIANARPSRGVDTLVVVFDEAVNGVDLSDFTLTLNGGANLFTGDEVFSSIDNEVFTISGVAGLTNSEGTYEFRLNAAGSDIVDLAGNVIEEGTSLVWVVDATAPTATIVDIAPDPRNTSVPSVQIVFSEPVTELSPGDLRLTRNGGGNLINKSVSVATTDGITWTVSGLDELTAVSGSYVFELVASKAGPRDASGNRLETGDQDAWVVDLTPPTLTPINAPPASVRKPVGSLSLLASETITGLDISDFVLRRNGVSVPLTDVTLVQSGNQYTLNNLMGAVNRPGSYTLELSPEAAGVTDSAGNALAESISVAWQLLMPGDIDGTGKVDIADFALFRTYFNTSTAAADFNESGRVDLADFAILRRAFNLTSEQVTVDENGIPHRIG